MLPFSIELKPGFPVAEQIVFAVRKAVVVGQLRPGDRFPSVRVLSQELRVNPNTAQLREHAALVQETRKMRIAAGASAGFGAILFLIPYF